MTDVRAILRRLQLGEPDRRIARDLGVSRNTVARYRDWATPHQLLERPLPEPATLAALLAPALRERPPHEQSLVEPFRDRLLALRQDGVEGQAIYDPEVQRSYREFAEPHGFLIAPCRPRTPEHKGRVEQREKDRPMDLTHQLAPMLRTLRPSGIVETLEVRNRQAVEQQVSFAEFLTLLVQDEGFDFSFNPKLNKAQVFDLATCQFIERHENVLIRGPTGVGKSHVGQAFAHEPFKARSRPPLGARGLRPNHHDHRPITALHCLQMGGPGWLYLAGR